MGILFLFFHLKNEKVLFLFVNKISVILTSDLHLLRSLQIPKKSSRNEWKPAKTPKRCCNFRLIRKFGRKSTSVPSILIYEES